MYKLKKMNYSLIKKSLYKIPDDTSEGPFKIINPYNFLYYNDDEIKCINMKTGKTNFALKIDDGLMEPYFGIVNRLKLIAKLSNSEIEVYQINKSLTECKKIKALKIEGFELARSLSDEGYIIGCNNIMIFNSKDELEFSVETNFSFYGFDWKITPPFEIKIVKNEKKNLLVFPMRGRDTNIYLRYGFQKVMNINSPINDALDMKDGNIILACREELILVDITTYKIEYKVECPQIEEELKYGDFHSFYDIFEFKNDIFITISGHYNQADNSYLLSVWNYNLNRNIKIENVQCLKFDDYNLMLDKEKLLILDTKESVIQINIKEIKGKAKNIVNITTESEFNKNKKKKKMK